MANKTAYEIRADLLVLAQKICYDQCKQLGANTAPTTKMIIDTAKELNTFVSEVPSGTKKTH